MRLHTGKLLPAPCQGAIFTARLGPWHRRQKYADLLAAWPDGQGGTAGARPLLSGFVEKDAYLGRPVDALVMKDGSLRVRGDHSGRPAGGGAAQRAGGSGGSGSTAGSGA